MQGEAGRDADSGPDTAAVDDAQNYRDHTADDRERTADDRDRAADERERIADDRESAANVREQRLVAWEVRLDRRDRLSSGNATSARQRGREATARARDLLTASAERLDRSEAALQRADDSDSREQRAVDREVAASQPSSDEDDDPSDPAALAGRAARLRMLLAATALGLADAEDLLADHHRRLCRDNPDGPGQHRLLADEAHARAELARETAQRFPS